MPPIGFASSCPSPGGSTVGAGRPDKAFMAPGLTVDRQPSSEARGLAVPAWIAGREVAVIEAPDRLAAAELVVVIDGDYLVTPTAQLLQRRLREALLDAHLHVLHPAKARAVTRGLRVLAVVGDS